VSRPLHYGSPDDLRQVLQAGDSIRVTTTDGRTVVIDVVEVSPTEIVGTRESIPLGEIVQVTRRDFSASKVLTYAGAGLVALSAIFLIVLFTAGN